MTMDATDPVSITLEARQWNVIIEVLHEAPYRVAAPLINAIATQARTAAEPPEEAAAPATPAPDKANGQAPPEGPAAA
jgi:hypothetical protein